ncbi:hypothetical protein (plasmid) [Corynebacterium efficiens YS-314]|uniref:Uncharacterized protein n=1 Tax=Corynebacterium efficiens (strain DSM 44549 / YS-314 / AJ 12310 / JCM 11189 / NBRC 100395) TaxID=196164 RepID=Q8FLG2_COREF|nr:hypothetical protein [Corynebacterium efficiens YS-314]
MGGKPHHGSGRREETMGEVAYREQDKQRDHHRPHHHAVQAQNVDDEQGLVPQPDDEQQAHAHPGLQTPPVPVGEAGPGQHRHRGGNDHGEGNDADQRIREAEQFGLPGAHHLSAGDQGVDVTGGDVFGVLVEGQALQHQDSGGHPSDYPGDQQDEGERTMVGKGRQGGVVVRLGHENLIFIVGGGWVRHGFGLVGGSRVDLGPELLKRVRGQELAVEEEGRGAAHTQGRAVGHIESDPFLGGRIGDGGVIGGHVQTQVFGETAENRTLVFGGLAPLGLGLEHPVVHRFVLALLGSGLHRHGGRHGVAVTLQREVTVDEGDGVGILLPQFLHEGVRRPAGLALEIEKLHQHGLLVRRLRQHPTVVPDYLAGITDHRFRGGSGGGVRPADEEGYDPGDDDDGQQGPDNDLGFSPVPGGPGGGGGVGGSAHEGSVLCGAGQKYQGGVPQQCPARRRGGFLGPGQGRQVQVQPSGEQQSGSMVTTNSSNSLRA